MISITTNIEGNNYMRFVSHSAHETQIIAKAFARGLEPGSIILANGDLGAGKTAFAKGLALGLGIKQIVNSPTFNIMKVYQGEKLKLYHIDAYRLEDPDSISDIGLEEALGEKDGISFVEWPKFIAPIIAQYKHYYEIRVNVLDNSDRAIEINEVIRND